jgi:hypothetical protein
MEETGKKGRQKQARQHRQLCVYQSMLAVTESCEGNARGKGTEEDIGDSGQQERNRDIVCNRGAATAAEIGSTRTATADSNRTTVGTGTAGSNRGIVTQGSNRGTVTADDSGQQ